MDRYHISTFYSEEDVAYIADIPDLRYCAAFGKTPQAALKQALAAKSAWLAAAKRCKRRVPKPRYRPAIYQTAG